MNHYAPLIVESRGLKSLRETLCRAQSAVALRTYDVAYILSDVEKISRLINEIDRHRPLGPDGKHDYRHTSTCGCEDT